ncbi:urease accessory protein UreD [Neorhizobium sp. P12A]|nr:urease accessory protein UreD [Neorhizobium sp. P12A]
MSTAYPVPPVQFDLGFVRRGDRTVLDRRIFSWPFVITRTFRLDPVPAHMLTVIAQSSSGAFHGEDHLRQHLRLEEGAAAHVTTQGATSVHRADNGLTAYETVNIGIARGAYLEYLPEPRILFPGAALVQRVNIHCAPGGMAIVADAFTSHDPDRRNRPFRALEATTALYLQEDEPVLIDRMSIGGPGRLQPSRYKAFGTMLAIMSLPPETLGRIALDLSAQLTGVSGLYAAASVLPGNAGIGVRFAACDLRLLRLGSEMAWFAFRRMIFGTPPVSRRKDPGA